MSLLFRAALHQSSEFLIEEFITRGQYVSELDRLHHKLRARAAEHDGVLRVVDAGANVGLFGMFAESMCGPTFLTGFEPIPINREFCETNWEGIPHVIHSEALSDRSGSVTIHLISYTGATIVPEELEGWKQATGMKGCPAAQINQVPLDAVDAGRVDLFKLDIEGSELAALQGAKQTLRRDRPFVFCTYEHYTSFPDLLEQELVGWKASRDDDLLLLTFEP